MADITGQTVVGVGKAGAANGGDLVHFEFVAPSGHKTTFLAPYRAMNQVLFALQTAMRLATTERQKRPGYNPAEDSLKLGLKNYGTAIGMAQGQETLVSLHLQTELEVSLDLMLPQKQARELGKLLADAADQAAQTTAPKPN